MCGLKEKQIINKIKLEQFDSYHTQWKMTFNEQVFDSVGGVDGSISLIN